MPTGADVTGTYSILSLILTLSVTPSFYTLVYVSLYLCFCIGQMERCFAPNLSHSGSQYSKSCDPIRYLLPLHFIFYLCLCLTISTHIPSFPVSSSPRQRQTKAFHFSLADLHSVCLYCTKLGSLSYCIPSFSLQRRCLGAPGSAW